MPARRNGAAVAATYLVATTAFAGTAGLLAARVHAGGDPAIGAGPAASLPPAPARVVVTRRVHRKTIVTTRVVRRPRVVAAAPSVAPSTAGSQSHVAAAASPAPAPAAPAAAAPAAPAVSAPAAAPAAPATPVTRAS